MGEKKTPWLSGWGAKHPLIFVLGCVKSIPKKPKPNLPKKCSFRVVLMSFSLPLTYVLAGCPRFCLRMKILGFAQRLNLHMKEE